MILVSGFGQVLLAHRIPGPLRKTYQLSCTDPAGAVIIGVCGVLSSCMYVRISLAGSVLSLDLNFELQSRQQIWRNQVRSMDGSALVSTAHGGQYLLAQPREVRLQAPKHGR